MRAAEANCETDCRVGGEYAAGGGAAATRKAFFFTQSRAGRVSSSPEKNKEYSQDRDGGKAANTPIIADPKTSAVSSFAAPSMTTLPPERAPNLYCPASPPEPWHIGIAPNRHDDAFMIPTLIDIGFVFIPFFGEEVRA